MKIFPLFAAIAGLTAGLALVPAAVATADITAAAPPLVSQASADNACIALQEVTTGQSEVRKRIETRPLGRNNWHVDFFGAPRADLQLLCRHCDARKYRALLD